MFYDGDLQSGIALAIQQAKSVACFVRDDSAESIEWEKEWLQVDPISQILQSKSVVLRIQAGSQEAGFLSAFCPITEIPALAIIYNGQLLDLITASVTKDEFGRRIQEAFGEEPQACAASQPHSPPTSTTLASRQAPTAPCLEDEPASAVAPASNAESPRREREARTTASKGKQKQSDPQPDPISPSNSTTQTPAARNEWLEQQRQRKSEARRERERVMAQIEADKAERRARREQERLAREQAANTERKTTMIASSSARKIVSKATSSNLQVRLLDGGQIRKQFPADASLEADVRPWIDSNLETKAPYTFKHILAPQPARAISVSEEHASLRELDLLPSATLVLQPIETYSDAYESQSGGLLSLPYNAVSGAYGLVSGTLSGAANWLRGGLFRPEDDAGGRTLADPPQQESVPEQRKEEQPADVRQPPTSRGNIRIRTLADQRDGSTDQQFYNGNSLDFEPNADESSTRR